MSDCAQCFQNSCPESVPVTINQTLVNLGDGAAFYEEVFSVDAGTITLVGTRAVLAHTPLAGSLQVFIGGSVQQATVDYTLSTATITFTTAVQAGVTVFVKYLALV